MTQNQPDTDREEPLSQRRLAPSAAILGAHIALTAALGHDHVVGTEHDQRTVDLLLRLEMSPTKAMRAVDLCEQLMVTASHTSRLIDRVEQLGLVARTPDPDDRRANQVVLTKQGTEVVGEIAPHMAAVLDRIFHETLDPVEIQTLIALLGRVESEARTPTG
jgi:DNA-binding MarR family transcriptional regulator